jgi:predicted nucleic acid-binding protein
VTAAGSSWLLDTNVLSETRRKSPDPAVARFFEAIDPQGIYLSVLTIGELRKGAKLKGKSDRIAEISLSAWIDKIEAMHADRILPVSRDIAQQWGEWSAERPRPVIDTLLAATAFKHNATFVTRNLSDVHDLPVKCLNPWEF